MRNCKAKHVSVTCTRKLGHKGKHCGIHANGHGVVWSDTGTFIHRYIKSDDVMKSNGEWKKQLTEIVEKVTAYWTSKKFVVAT